MSKKLLTKSVPEILLIYAIVLLGAIKDRFAIFSFAPQELLILFLFARVLFKSRYVFHLSKIDLSFFIFYLGVYIIPIFFNLYEFRKGEHQIIENILIIKIWFVFKIFETYLLKKDSFTSQAKINLIIRTFLNAALISSILGLLFFFDFVDKSLLYKTKHLDEFRLSTTVGGINTTGVFFGLMFFTELYFSFLNHRKLSSISLIRMIFFLSNLLLSGSMTGLGIMIIAVAYFYLRQFSVQRFVVAIFYTIIIILISSQLPFFDRASEVFLSRTNDVLVDNKYRNETVLPENFYGRYLEWEVLTDKILRDKPLMGYGFKSVEYDGARETNFRDVRIVIPESYYMNILIFGGLFGLLCYMIHIFINFKVLFRAYRNENKLLISYILIVMVSFLFAQITQTTLQYSTISEFYGLMLALLSLIYYRSTLYGNA